MSKTVMVKHEIKCSVCGDVIGSVSLPSTATDKQIANAVDGYICDGCAEGKKA